jgi:hypothetical protein
LFTWLLGIFVKVLWGNRGVAGGEEEERERERL